jgi:hypothetical protein
VHQVFVGGYLDALKNVALVPIAMVLVAALTTVLLPRLAKRAPAATQVAEEVAA